MMDEEDLQRRELQRLLSTAKDDTRRDVIRKALESLETNGPDEVNEKLTLSRSPSLKSTLFNPQQNVVLESARSRPMSAARRRPSITNLLDAIPEVNQAPRTASGKEEDIILPYDDIAEVVCSSFDARYQPKSIFKSLPGQGNGTVSSPVNHSMLGLPHQYPGHHPSMSRGGSTLNLSNKPPRPRGLWISTGMMPQFIVVTFYEKWIIKKIELFTKDVEKVSVHINFSAASAFSSAKLIEMDKVSDDRFVVDVVNKSGSSNNLSSDLEVGVNGIGVTFFLQKGKQFCGIKNAKIYVGPHS